MTRDTVGVELGRSNGDVIAGGLEAVVVLSNWTIY